MAVYYLEKSPMYKQQTDPKVYRRREVVALNLQDNYKVRKFGDDEVYAQIVAALALEQIEVTKSTYQADKVVLRTAYLWLAADEAGKGKIQTTNSPGGVGVNCLKKDGILNWEQLGYGAAQADTGAEEEEVSVVPAPPKFQLADFQAGKLVLSSISELVGGLEDMLAENEALQEEVARLTAEAEPLKNRAAEDQKYIELVEGELATQEQRVRDLREAVRNAQAAGHAATLEAMAEQHPEIPQLTVIVQQLRERHVKEDRVAELLAKLPSTFTWLSDVGKIEYRDQFLKALGGLTVEEQGQAIGQLETFATQGLEYGSLHTRKNIGRLPYSPRECMSSRGADDIRFTWKKNGHIVVYWLYRKNDTRARQSEK